MGMKCEQRSTKDIVSHRIQQQGEPEGRLILPPVTGPSELPASWGAGRTVPRTLLPQSDFLQA